MLRPVRHALDAIAYVKLAICAVAGGWLILRFVGFAHGYAGLRPYHVEAAATLFAAVVILTVALSRARTAIKSQSSPRIGPIFAVGFVAASLFLYWPAIFSGLFSDDFVLLARVERGQYGAVSTSLVRPLVMMIWRTLQAAHLGPASFHLLNIVLHGVVGYLAAQLTANWTQSRTLAVAAGLVTLTHSAAVEPVVWVSGAFDVVATTLVLATVMAARRYGAIASISVRFTVFALAIGSVLAKETAAVVGVLVGVDAWMRRSLTRLVAIDASILAAGAVIYGWLRLSGTGEASALH